MKLKLCLAKGGEVGEISSHRNGGIVSDHLTLLVRLVLQTPQQKDLGVLVDSRLDVYMGGAVAHHIDTG